ncbi:carbohydrate ABC transporter permease [Nonomuraea sp. 3-1Str]|uniref:carbohydrate ABC transporter permease n=1 Tax=Nonomuraea sp. 3-1Str TaxID=2929801 RepID=UPI002860A825|nr:carbohydrate ABC transporter permease [Nonomuraea sp. 3-1Str]MDR8411392.1 carbohydrate ABC transporter permease [Nonomuraea sp. 3-1Str]
MRALGIRILLWGYAAFSMAPLVVMVLSSFRPTSEIFDQPLGWPTGFGNYAKAWTEASFSTYVVNSTVVVVCAVLLGAVVSLLAAYPLGRREFRGRSVFAAYFVSGMTLPAHLGVLPLFYLLESMGLVDSLAGLVLVYAAGSVPFNVFVLTAFFRQLPYELDEAAALDGAGPWATFWHVMLPLVRPALATVVVFQFVPIWNDFFYPLVLMRDESKLTLPVGLTHFFGQFQNDWGTIFAGLVMTTIPLVVLFVLAARQIVAGLTAGMNR